MSVSKIQVHVHACINTESQSVHARKLFVNIVILVFSLNVP